MANYKIVFAGPVGAGKSTAIASLSDTAPVSTEARASDMTAERKPTTTVAMDYGTMRLDGGESVHLFGTPGQERFDFMWDILTEGGLGLILLIDNTREHPFQDMKFFLDAFGDYIRKTALCVGITRIDLRRTPGVAAHARQLESYGFRAPVFAVDARRRHDVVAMTQALLYSMDPGVSFQ
jgi:signal recognition particle receptor subunit beta